VAEPPGCPRRLSEVRGGKGRSHRGSDLERSRTRRQTGDDQDGELTSRPVTRRE
jgi:hypothetical protein